MEQTTGNGTMGRFRELFKKSNPLLLITLFMLAVPVALINDYQFFMQYHNTHLNINKLDIASLSNLVANVDWSASDIVLFTIAFLLTLFANIFVIILVLAVLKSEQPEEIHAGDILKTGIVKIGGMLVLSYFLQVLSQGLEQLMMTVLALAGMVVAAQYTLYTLILMGVAMLLAVALYCFALCFVTVLLYNMMIAYCIGRTNMLFSMPYVREMLRGRVLRRSLKLLPWVILIFLVPLALDAAAVFMILFGGLTTGALIVETISVLVNIMSTGLLWLYLVPAYFKLEEESGVQDKIRQAMENAMSQTQQKTQLYPEDEPEQKEHPEDEPGGKKECRQ